MLQVPIEHPTEYFKYRNASPSVTKDPVTIYHVMPVKDVISKVTELVHNVSGRWKWTRIADKEDLIQTVLMMLMVRKYDASKTTPHAFLNVVACSEILKVHNKLGSLANFTDWQAMRPSGEVLGGFDYLVEGLNQGPMDYIGTEERQTQPAAMRTIKVTKGGEVVGCFPSVATAAKALGLVPATVQGYVRGYCRSPDGYQFEVILTPGEPKPKREMKRQFGVYHPSGKLLGYSSDVYGTADDLKLTAASIYGVLKRGGKTKGGYRFKWVS